MNATINDLPPEMVGHLLQHLNLKQLVEMKRVCKLWNELITSQLKVKRLIVELCANSEQERWWHVGRPVDYYLEVCSVHLFVTQLKRPILANLKHLRIDAFDRYDYSHLRDFNPNDLNVFSQLVQLEVQYQIPKPSIKIDCNFPHLKMLRFQFWLATDDHFQMSIDCPNLKVLYGKYREGDLIEIKSPETITTLYCSSFNGLKMAKFKNIEILKCSAGFNSLNETLIEQLPKLKRLDLNAEVQGFLYELESVDEIRRFLKRLLSDRKKVGRYPGFKLIFSGIEISDETLVDHLNLQVVQFGEGHPARLSNENLYLGEYPAVCKLNLKEELEFVEHADYSSLMNFVNEIPGNYFKRFWRIKHLTTYAPIQDTEHFAFYIKQLEYLNDLSLHYPALPQEWYDRLPTICKLKNFTLNEKDETKLCYDFLFEYYPITFLKLSDKDDFFLRSARSIPNLIRFFRCWRKSKFNFNFRGAKMKIRMRRSQESEESSWRRLEAEDVYDVLINKKLKLEKANLMEVLNFFEDLEKELL